jgi:hypothetical protein
LKKSKWCGRARATETATRRSAASPYSSLLLLSTSNMMFAVFKLAILGCLLWGRGARAAVYCGFSVLLLIQQVTLSNADCACAGGCGWSGWSPGGHYYVEGCCCSLCEAGHFCTSSDLRATLNPCPVVRKPLCARGGGHTYLFSPLTMLSFICAGHLPTKRRPIILFELSCGHV